MGSLRSKLTWTKAMVVVLALAVLGGGTALAATHAATRRPKLMKVSMLYVLSAGHGVLRPEGKTTYTLHLKGVDRDAVWFSDRPVRRSGATPVAGFADSWKPLGFVADPPNAALDYTDRAGRRRTAVFELSAPRYAAQTRTLTFKARLLDPESVTAANLADHARAADTYPPGRLDDLSLFVDDSEGEAPVIGRCVLANYPYCPATDFRGVDLAGYSFRDGEFRSSLWQGDDLSGAEFTGAGLTSGQFQKADLSGANLTIANLSEANLQGADLKGANLEGADLQETHFEGADLENANLEHANLDHAFLENANITGANFKHADVCNVIWVDGEREEECP
jgi:uncharacterized protein YjbI with pentapeptide repeats